MYANALSAFLEVSKKKGTAYLSALLTGFGTKTTCLSGTTIPTAGLSLTHAAKV